MPRGDTESSERRWDSIGKGPVGRGSLSDGQVLMGEKVGPPVSSGVPWRQTRGAAPVSGESPGNGKEHVGRLGRRAWDCGFHPRTLGGRARAEGGRAGGSWAAEAQPWDAPDPGASSFVTGRRNRPACPALTPWTTEVSSETWGRGWTPRNLRDPCHAWGPGRCFLSFGGTDKGFLICRPFPARHLAHGTSPPPSSSLPVVPRAWVP